jgi:hypothetical protein
MFKITTNLRCFTQIFLLTVRTVQSMNKTFYVTGNVIYFYNTLIP